MQAYEYRYRIRAIELYNQGVQKIRISEELGVNDYTILNWIKRYEQHGESGLKAIYSKWCEISK
jgi:transposase